MFFDVKKKLDLESEALRIKLSSLVLALVKKQNILYQNRCFTEDTEVQALKEKIRVLIAQNQREDRIYWWELPWTQVLKKIIADTKWKDEIVSESDWDWEYELLCEEMDGMQFLCLMEHGRKYGVDILQDNWEYNRDSAFSESEQNELIGNYKKRINNYELFMAATTEGPVHSELTDRTYDSMWHYYTSVEAWMIRDHFTERFKRSLYTERQTHHLSAMSANIHTRKIWEVAGFHITDGVLDFLQPENFSLISAYGAKVNITGIDMTKMDSAVFAADYLAKAKEVRSVPMNLLCRNLTQGAASYEAAMRQAEMLVCFAEKICE